MGRNYWCEFCNRGFADILTVRKKHLKSTQHQKMRKLYYDSFKDPATILQEESTKNPCHKFFKTGHCDFGDHCRFSHKNIAKLKQEIHSKSKTQGIDLDRVNDWLEKWKKKHRDIHSELPKYRMPPGFTQPNQLPASLQPPIENLQLEPVKWE